MQRGHRYYTTPAWYRRKDAVRHRAGGICEFCRHRRMTQLHHRTYANFGREPLSELMAVCRACHRAIHGLLRRGTRLTCTEESLLARGDRGVGDSALWKAYLRACQRQEAVCLAS